MSRPMIGARHAPSSIAPLTVSETDPRETPNSSAIGTWITPNP